MSENQTVINAETVTLDAPVSRRGGARAGAGRKRFGRDAREFAARFDGYTALTAKLVLERLGDEWRIWKRVLESEDDRVVLAAMQFLVSMRDGRPAQQVNVTSLNLSVNAEDVAKARAIVAELRNCDSVRPPFAQRTESEQLMLCGGEGGKEDGEVG